MSRVYNIIGADQSVANVAVTTLISIRPSTGLAIEILRMWISQHANATSAQLRIGWGQQASAFGTLTTGITPQKVIQGDPASGITSGTAQAAGTCGINASTEAVGTKTQLGCDAFNALNGWLWVPGGREGIILTPSSASAFYLAFTAVPGTLSGWNFGMTFREIG